MSEEVSSVQCDGCGARLKKMGDGVNVNCEYCGILIRVVGEGSEQYNIANIVSQFVQLNYENARKDSFDSRYERTKVLIEQGKYVEASAVLNKILEDDVTQSRAWYYKSILPVLESDDVKFRGHLINVRVISKLTNKKMITMYLNDCGLHRRHHAEFMRFYGSTNFLHDQTIKFLDKAIEYASSNERREFLGKQKNNVMTFYKKNLRKRRAENIAWTLLALGTLAVVIIGGAWLIISETI